MEDARAEERHGVVQRFAASDRSAFGDRQELPGLVVLPDGPCSHGGVREREADGRVRKQEPVGAARLGLGELGATPSGVGKVALSQVPDHGQRAAELGCRRSREIGQLGDGALRPLGVGGEGSVRPLKTEQPEDIVIVHVFPQLRRALERLTGFDERPDEQRATRAEQLDLEGGGAPGIVRAHSLEPAPQAGGQFDDARPVASAGGQAGRAEIPAHGPVDVAGIGERCAVVPRDGLDDVIGRVRMQLLQLRRDPRVDGGALRRGQLAHGRIAQQRMAEVVPEGIALVAPQDARFGRFLEPVEGRRQLLAPHRLQEEEIEVSPIDPGDADRGARFRRERRDPFLEQAIDRQAAHRGGRRCGRLREFRNVERDALAALQDLRHLLRRRHSATHP